jgi:O-antigen/teichoic acid export membrane protein
MNKIIDKNYMDKQITGVRVVSGLAKRTAQDMALYFPTIILQGVIGLIVAAILSKHFSPDHYGNYVLAFGIYNLLITMSGMWIHLSIIRLVPEYISKNQYNNLIFTLVTFALLILSAFTFIGISLILLIGNRINEELNYLIIVSLFGSLFMIGSLAIESLYRISGRSAKYSIIVLLRIVSGLGFGLLLAFYFRLEIFGFFIGLVLPNLLIVIWFIWIKWTKWLNVFKLGVYSKKVLVDAFSYSLPFVGMNLSAMILGISAHYIIGGYLTVYEVGIYAISYMIASQGITVLINVITTASDPISINTWEKSGPIATYDYLTKLIQLYAIFVIPAWIGLFVMGKELITLFSTPEYAVGTPIIGLVGLGSLFHGFTQMLNRIFVFTKITIPPLVNFTIISIINVILNILLIPKFGYIAAAWSTLISYFLLFLLTIITTRRIVSIKWWGGYLWKALLSAIGMGLIIYFCGSISASVVLNLVLLIAISVFCYIVLIVLLGGINANELKQLFHVFKSLNSKS